MKAAPVSRRFHSLIVRIVHNRMTLATGLDGHKLMLECYHPSAKLTAGKMYCTYLGTDGLVEALDQKANEPAGHIGYLRSLYSRFQPYRQETGRLIQQRTIPGDIPGSRTHPASPQNQREQRLGIGVLPTETVSLDAHELFSQLCVVSHMAKIAARKSVIQSFVELSDGVIRLRRDWLGQQLNKVVTESAGRTRLSEDSSILWVNNCNDDVGIKFRVRQHKPREDQPILYASEEEVAVSYYVEFEGKSSMEVVLRPRLTAAQNC